MLGGRLFYLHRDFSLYTVGDYYEFKKADYYQKAGFHNHKKQEDRWMRGPNGFTDLFNDLSRNSTKTTDINQLNENFDYYGDEYGRLWREVSKRRHRRLNPQGW